MTKSYVGFAGGAFIQGPDTEEAGSPPTQMTDIPNITALAATDTHDYDLSGYFSGATSYAISPAVETGWSFDTDTGVLTIDTDDTDVFGPYTVTATNDDGDTASNAFSVTVRTAATGRARPVRWGSMMVR